MSKLEPTRTYSNPTATEILRRMLDERGVEYRIDDAKTVRVTKWEFGEHSSAMFTEYDDGECVFVTSGHTWTPAQAIAATVGSDKVEAVLRKLIARLGVAADFHFARKYVDCIVEE